MLLTYTEYSKYDEEYDFEEMPISIIGNLEQYKLSSSERIHSLEDSPSSRTDLFRLIEDGRQKAHR